MKRFAVFILTHGRARTISTYDACRKAGYTGDIWVVIDNEDNDEQLYREKFGNQVIQFDKRDYVPLTDLGDLDDDRRIGVLARNFIQDKAKDMGYKYHLQLDDDIHGFCIRYEKDGKLKSKKIKKLDVIFDSLCYYMDNAPITSLSFSLPAYFPGGMNKHWEQKMLRKTMTTFLMRADDVNFFHMRMNDDITTGALNGMRGKLYFTIMPLCLEVDETQKQSGGMTEIYQDNGTYRKSFYSVMAMPSCAKVSTMGVTQFRCHHRIEWKNCVPKILNEKYRK